MRNNTKHTTSHASGKGCSGTVVALLVLAIFLPVAVYAWISQSTFEAVICTCIAVMSFAALIGFFLKERREKAGTKLKALEEEHKQKEAERIAALPNYFEVKISKNFFREVQKTATAFPDLLQNLFNSGFCSWLEEQELPVAKGSDTGKLARCMMLSDIKTALTGMKTSCEWGTKEGFALYAATNAITSENALEYDQLKAVTDETLQPAKKLLDGSYTFLNKEQDSNKLVLADLLQSFDRDVQRQYLIALYRFLSIAAKADEVVTEQETRYLQNLIARAKAIEESIALKNELDSLVGLIPVKKEIQTLTNFIKIQQKRAEQGLKTSPMSYHCVFTGSPGTGKTTVARIIAGIYRDLGILKKGHLVETDRSGLVAEFIGQTAVQTNKIIDSALDGVLFIDEAYSLAGGGENDYGKEAISTLLKRMEDNRDRLAVILAGYTKEMKQFIDSNPGLQSRFSRYIEFPDYTAAELLQIFEVNMNKYDYHFGKGAKDVLQQYLEKAVAGKDINFGNGRFVRNIFEKTLEHQANRLAPESNLTTQRLSEISMEDIVSSTSE